MYEFTEIKSKDGFITDTKVKIVNQSDGKVLYENMLDEIKKDETKTGFQYLQEYRLIDLNGDGSDELILNGYVGMSPYFLFGNGYIIDKTKSYLPLYEIQNLDMQNIDSVNMILKVVEKESPAVLGLWNTYNIKYTGSLELIFFTNNEFNEMLTDDYYKTILETHTEINSSDDICENFPPVSSMKGYYSYYWLAIENIFYNAYVNNNFSRAETWYLEHNTCANKIEILKTILDNSKERYNNWKNELDGYYMIKYIK